MGQIGCPETTVRNYHYSLRDKPEERNSHVLGGGGLKSRSVFCLATSCSPQCSCRHDNRRFMDSI
jgi:hypothetical protein